MSDATTSSLARAGWSIPAFCNACDFSRATFYNLPPELRPQSLKLGKRHIIIEPPGDYLRRLAASQAEA